MGLGVLCFPVPFFYILCLASKLVFWVGSAYSQKFPLSRIPGPTWAAYTRLWLIKTLASGKSAQRFIDVNNEYGKQVILPRSQPSNRLWISAGSLARVGPNHLMTSDPEITRKVLAVSSKYTRAPWFDALKIDPHVSNIVSERDPKKHHRLRYQFSAGLAGTGSNMEIEIDDHICKWLERIGDFGLSHPGSPKVFDIGKSIQYLTVDIISHLCLGEEFGCVENDNDQYNFLGAVETGTIASLYLSVSSELRGLLSFLTTIPFMHRLLVPSAKDKDGIGRVMGVSTSSPSLKTGQE